MSNNKDLRQMLESMNEDHSGIIEEKTEGITYPGGLTEKDMQDISESGRQFFGTPLGYPIPIDIEMICSELRDNGYLWASRALGTSKRYLKSVTKTDEYVNEVRRRVNEKSAEHYIERARRWNSPIDRILAGYYCCPIKHIRQMLDDISPRIRDSSLDPIDLANLPIEFPGEGVPQGEGAWHYDSIDSMKNVTTIDQKHVNQFSGKYEVGQRVSVAARKFKGKRSHGTVVGYRVFDPVHSIVSQFYEAGVNADNAFKPKPGRTFPVNLIVELDDGEIRWVWPQMVYPLKSKRK